MQGDPELVSAIYGRGMAYGKKSLQVSKICRCDLNCKRGAGDHHDTPWKTTYVWGVMVFWDEHLERRWNLLTTGPSEGLALVLCIYRSMSALALSLSLSRSMSITPNGCSLCAGHKECWSGSVRAQPRHHPGAKLAWGVWTESWGEAQPCAPSKSDWSLQRKIKTIQRFKLIWSIITVIIELISSVACCFH